jgi:hypothetical protein
MNFMHDSCKIHACIPKFCLLYKLFPRTFVCFQKFFRELSRCYSLVSLPKHFHEFIYHILLILSQLVQSQTDKDMQGGSTSEINSLDLKLGKFAWMVSILCHTKSLAAIIVFALLPEAWHNHSIALAHFSLQTLPNFVWPFCSPNFQHGETYAEFGHRPTSIQPGLSVH